MIVINQVFFDLSQSSSSSFYQWSLCRIQPNLLSSWLRYQLLLQKFCGLLLLYLTHHLLIMRELSMLILWGWLGTRSMVDPWIWRQGQECTQRYAAICFSFSIIVNATPCSIYEWIHLFICIFMQVCSFYLF